MSSRFRFSDIGRGIVVTGRIEQGTVKIGRGPLKSTVTGVEMFKKILDNGQAGDNVGLLLRGLKRDDVQRGQRKDITSYFQPKKKQTTTCEDEEPSAASIEVTGDGVEPLIFGGINRNSEQNPQNPEIVNEGIDSDFTDEIIDFNSLIRDPGLRKTDMYPLVDRLLRLVLTLPASTATSERAFSAMKIVKTSLRNRMEDEFLRDYLIVYIEKEIAETISAEKIIDSFYLIKERPDVTGKVELPENVKMVMPGDNVTATFELMSPVPLQKGQRFALREGGRTVGAGVVSKVLK
ncbi:hypothetical protein AgCh_032521 [Apium graveolens]